MLASDHKNTVFSEVRKDGRQDLVYTAYGKSPVTGSFGYNGERCETPTGWYMLGNGYRAYNPGLMRFHSPDDLSPFEEGGLNSYMYCEGNPIDYLDPDGTSIFSVLSRLGRSIAGIFTKTAPKAAKAAKAAKTAKVQQTTKVLNKGSNKGKRGNFFKDLGNGKIQTKPLETGKDVLNPRNQLVAVKGPKAGVSLEKPPSGAKQLRDRLKKPVLQQGVLNSHKTHGSSGMSMAESTVKAIRQAGGSQQDEAARSIQGFFVQRR
ncbi:MAG: RHS repeat-associated core domain-containing protein [Pseudomonadales bacterium]|nr:RHS repeat-associated core domain-containing protein [Pseudomonadales bacterium]MBH2079358.1 RHS repeat-associated core domain-containing protein [Pseudomonadales bacterium]